MDKYYLIVGLLLILGICSFVVLFKKMKDGIGQYNLKIYGITFVGLLVTLLAISPIESSSLSPAFGILGAIAGYLFGLKNEN